MSTRVVYDVVPSLGGKLRLLPWKVSKRGDRKFAAFCRTKDVAIHVGAACAKAEELGQVVVHLRDGTIEYEWTYPDASDPSKSPG